MIPKLDQTKLTPEQRDKLDAYHQAQQQITTLKDIADMTQEVVNALDKQTGKQASEDSIQKLGTLLVDVKETLDKLNAKETPDSSQPIIDAISKLKTALEASVKAQKPPVVNVPKADAPTVNVTAPKLDFTGIEKVLKQDIPKAFEQAIKTIPESNDQNIIDALTELSTKLDSIDTGVRLKPIAPTKVQVTGVTGDDLATEATLAKTVGFDENDDITIDWTDPNEITETDGIKTLTTTITGTVATQVWS